MEKQKKLYDKLRKLLALKDSALEVGSIGEAEAAAAAVQRLLREYNLAEEEIPIGERIANPVVMEKLPYYYSYRNDWFFGLLGVLSHANLCESLHHKKRAGRKVLENYIFIIGRETNVKMVSFLAMQLANRFVFFCKEAYKEYRMKQLYSGCAPLSEALFARDYLGGCVDGLSLKLEKEQNVTEQGLVLSRKAENDKFMDERFGKRTIAKDSKRKDMDEDVFWEGVEKGRNVDIYQGIEKEKGRNRELPDCGS